MLDQQRFRWLGGLVDVCGVGGGGGGGGGVCSY